MRLVVFFLAVSSSVACTSSNENHSSELPKEDTVIHKLNPVNQPEQNTLDSSSVERYEADDASETDKIIEKKYGVQWDFCDCIVKNDSIQKAIDSAGDISDEAFDLLMKRFEEIDQHCKSIITNPNRTPDERKAHQRKVKKCLQEN